MVLGFKQFFDPQKTQPTYFREKILAGVNRVWIRDTDGSEFASNNSWGAKMASEIVKIHTPLKPKITTIREGNRWKAGDEIHMAYGVRTKDYCQFNKGIPELERVKSVQRIKMWWTGALGITDEERENGVIHINLNCLVDGKLLDKRITSILAVNDGFETVTQFGDWFSKGFEGQIVHWSELRY